MQTILVVDDQSVVRSVMRQMLVSRGFDVVEAADGDAALVTFSQMPVDAAFIDIDMPGLQGPGVCRQLRALAAATDRPFSAVLMSGAGRGNAPAGEAGESGFLAKPFTLEELDRALDLLLSAAGAGMTVGS